MSDWVAILILYLLGALLIIAEFFLPAHGLIGLVGLGVLIFGLYETFQLNQSAGLVSLAILVVAIPTGLAVAIKNWHRTPVGRRISPPNPVLQDDDRMTVSGYKAFVGRRGRTVSALRPVGTCTFDGRRVECVAEYGVIEANVEVEGIGLKDRSLLVRAVDPAEQETSSA